MGFKIRPEIKTPPSYPLDEKVGEMNDSQNPFVRATEKTSQVGKQISAPKKEGATSARKIIQLAATDDLASRVSALDKHWDEMEPEALAESIVDLENRVALLDGEDPVARKVQERVQRFHFEFVFPITRELKTEGEFSFVKEINQIAAQILKQNSLLPFTQLAPEQQRSILHYAGR
ncbi:MAG TPA: hypothetical protein VLE89_05385 [Chlamydiales bacterium]|nr:hypothetical protein [Chlamydiales bacterium]